MDEVKLSPSQRMERFRRQMMVEESGLQQYLDSLHFSPDAFQEEALEILATGSSVLVCAPTGAGKTVVGEGAAFIARQRGQRVFYTTPIKALSNQKLRDFRQRFGDDEVGLLTGDTSINPDAPIVVMTTEVLRNMIYAGQNLDDLGVVVMDEVHYLSDRFRGPVWEEVLIQLPQHVLVVALSATLSNAQEFGRWVGDVRGSCEVVVSDRRPVPLYQHMMVGPRIYDLYARPREAAAGKGSKQINPDLLEAMNRAQERDLEKRGGRARGNRRRPAPVSRFRVIDRLRSRKLLPAIVFIFSRAGCDEAASEAATYGMNLVNASERELIREEIDVALATIPPEDHGPLDLHRWAYTLEEGVACHHAGLLPQQKEAVERLFAAGLIKVVFATETLALGINMPAKTVVIESMEKWNGSEHVRLSPREYTQLTGRAGRRGIDVEGHAVVLQRAVVTPEEVVELSSGGSYPLHSAFQPNYNMAVNLLSRLDLEESRDVLESSFAQFQTDASVVREAQRLRRANATLEGIAKKLSCDRGDAGEYFELREQISALQKHASRLARESRGVQQAHILRDLKVGDVVRFRRGRRLRTVVVVQAPSAGFATPLARVVGDDAKPGSIGPHEAENGLEVLGRMPVPERGAKRPSDRKDLAAALRHHDFTRDVKRSRPRDDLRVAKILDEVSDLERKMREHPVHSCPDREAHAVLGHDYARALRERNRIASRINSSSAQIVQEFDRVCTVLRKLSFLNENTVTKRGRRLRRIYGERDLLTAQILAEGAWDDLKPEELAAMVCAVVYEPRGDDGVSSIPSHFPTARLELVWTETMRIYEELHAAEVAASHEVTTPPAGQLLPEMYRWAKGASLASILESSELSGGDFVRWVRQVLDMLDQLRRLEESEIRSAATKARDRLLHGVVAWTEFA
ncbi:DEAD/DEAH box helicase [Actinomyces minihominis]|uniref:DEAD/DEAH box helicase n=1 Tax=Actinomyces minihominis TaxID=2002838 RepID=UPI000C0689D0|nr:DEAD/DEAH box helicase [Actinomyces minihominis]